MCFITLLFYSFFLAYLNTVSLQSYSWWFTPDFFYIQMYLSSCYLSGWHSSCTWLWERTRAREDHRSNWLLWWPNVSYEVVSFVYVNLKICMQHLVQCCHVNNCKKTNNKKTNMIIYMQMQYLLSECLGLLW